MKNKSNHSKGITGKSTLTQELKPKKIVFSFKDFDHAQGKTFMQWEQASLLNKMLNTLKEFSGKTIIEARQDHMTIYGNFPEKSAFKRPKHIPEDAVWASLRIQGKECIAGHIIDNIFYVTAVRFK